MAPSLIIHQYLANSHLLKYNINEIKETEIKDIQESDAILQEKKKKHNLETEIQTLLIKIEQTNQEINDEKKSKEHIKDTIINCQKKQKLMDTLESKLRGNFIF